MIKPLSSVTCALLAGALSLHAANENAPAPAAVAEPYTPSAPNQLMSLGGSNKPRFKLQDISWPQQPGQAEICLWRDDKYAALSITVDDNCRPDHNWWLAQCAEFGFPVTWFVVTGGVGGKNKGFNGTWQDFAKLLAAGHAVQTHTISHHKDDDKRSEEEVRRQYGGSKAALETNILGNQCLTVGYPYGKGQPALAGEYFIAARGVHGAPNVADRINYLNTGAGHLRLYMIDSILGDPFEGPKWLANPNYKRGWLTPLHHLVHHGRTPEAKEASAAKVRAFLEHAAARKDRLWIDTFVEVAKYGQERDSATLTVAEATDARITLAITDLMRDDIFNTPLTVKVRLPDAWKTVSAKQGEASVRANLVTHAGAPYALVDVVPDKGSVTLSQE